MTLPWILLTILASAFAIALFFVLKKNKNTEAQLKQDLELHLHQIVQQSLKDNREAFFELAKTQLDRESTGEKQRWQDLKKETQKEIEVLVGPLAEKLEVYKKGLESSEKERAESYGSLDKMLQMLMETNKNLQNETVKLSHALRKPTVRGRWGEVQLRRIVELSGMSRFCDFEEQTHKTGEDSSVRPDMIIRMPNGRDIIVDAKAVMEAYLDAESAENQDSREAALKKHALAIRTRIQDLSRKSYWDQFKKSPEFVVLFIPGEAFFSAALEADNTLVELGFQQKVVLATPTTLMALLRAVAFGWRQERMAENSRKIIDEAVRIYQGLSVWSTHLSQVGVSLDKATKAYNSSIGSLERRVFPPLRRIKELGVKSKDELKEPALVETAAREIAGAKTDASPE